MLASSSRHFINGLSGTSLRSCSSLAGPSRRPYDPSTTRTSVPTPTSLHRPFCSLTRPTSFATTSKPPSKAPRLSHPIRSFTTSQSRLVPPPATTTASPSTNPANAPLLPNKSIDPDAVSKIVSEKSQAKTDWTIIKKLAVNIWPKESFSTKARVVGALVLLVGGKVLNVQVPFFFKDIVDSLNVPITADTTVWVLAGAAIAGCELERWETGLM